MPRPSETGPTKAPKRTAALAAILLGSAGGLISLPAHGYSAWIQAEHQMQLYDVGSPGGVIVQRRRQTSSLGFVAENLQGDFDTDEPSLGVVARIRLDADTGQRNAERNPEQTGAYVPGLEQAPVDLIVAYLEARRLLGGHLNARLGRQLQIDALGFWSFDGAWLRLSPLPYLRLEALGGLEPRVGAPGFSSARYSADGVLRGDREGMPANLWPEYLDDEKVAPAYGFAVETPSDLPVSGRLAYRHVISRSEVVTAILPAPNGPFVTLSSARTASQRIGGSARASWQNVGNARSVAMYDLYASRLAEASVEVDALPAPTLTVGASYEYYLPSFDGDSIFNWFAQFPTHDAAIRSSWEINRRLLAATRTGVRRFGGRDENGRDKFDMAPLFEVTTRLQHAHGTARIRVSGFSGALRQQMGAGLSADRSIWDETASVLARFSAFRTQDELSRHPDWNSYSYMLGVEARALPETSLRLEFDHAINPLVGHRFRVVALLDLAVVR
ncbi:MAG: hypothetical protein HRU17_00755 [Polyangiaceae bacterium]|nr:hypothetical protein [Polyangiaceae bacterium]